ncbi:MAG: flagellar export chaperone FliS [Planctomycetota bacterium]
MLEKKIDQYLETHILTTPKPKLLLMLLEKIISLCQESKQYLEQTDYENLNNKLQQAQNILIELINALSETLDEKISKNLKNLYLFSFRQLVLANLEKDREKIDGVEKIISIIYDGFKKSLEKENGGVNKMEGSSINVER